MKIRTPGRLYLEIEVSYRSPALELSVSTDRLPAPGDLDGGPNRAPSGFLVDMLTSPDFAEEALANIGARYDHWVEKHGARKAALIFHAQCIGSVTSCWADWLMKRLQLLNFLRHS